MNKDRDKSRIPNSCCQNGKKWTNQSLHEDKCSQILKSISRKANNLIATTRTQKKNETRSCMLIKNELILINAQFLIRKFNKAFKCVHEGRTLTYHLEKNKQKPDKENGMREEEKWGWKTKRLCWCTACYDVWGKCRLSFLLNVDSYSLFTRHKIDRRTGKNYSVW